MRGSTGEIQIHQQSSVSYASSFVISSLRGLPLGSPLPVPASAGAGGLNRPVVDHYLHLIASRHSPAGYNLKSLMTLSRATLRATSSGNPSSSNWRSDSTHSWTGKSVPQKTLSAPARKPPARPLSHRRAAQ